MWTDSGRVGSSHGGSPLGCAAREGKASQHCLVLNPSPHRAQPRPELGSLNSENFFFGIFIALLDRNMRYTTKANLNTCYPFWDVIRARQWVIPSLWFQEAPFLGSTTPISRISLHHVLYIDTFDRNSVVWNKTEIREFFPPRYSKLKKINHLEVCE